MAKPLYLCLVEKSGSYYSLVDCANATGPVAAVCEIRDKMRAEMDSGPLGEMDFQPPANQTELDALNQRLRTRLEDIAKAASTENDFDWQSAAPSEWNKSTKTWDTDQPGEFVGFQAYSQYWLGLQTRDVTA